MYLLCYYLLMQLIAHSEFTINTNELKEKMKINLTMNKVYNFLLIVTSLFILSACGGNNKSNKPELAELYIEESFMPLFETSLYTFEGQKEMNCIEPNYVSEAEAIEHFFDRKTATICTTRDFTKEEKAMLLKSQNVEVRSHKIAIDAVALIVHPENDDTLISVDRLKKIINGEEQFWNNSKRKIKIVFDKANSANFRFMKNLVGFNKLPENVFAVNSNEEVINFIQENRNAMGIIGVNWISDEDDPKTLSFRNGINIVGVAKNDSSEYFKPYQAYIYEGYHLDKGYPLVREVWMITKASRTSCSSSFMNFMTSEKGQLIIQKSSLIPANMVARMLNISTK